jgi:hypothetical protein
MCCRSTPLVCRIPECGVGNPLVAVFVMPSGRIESRSAPFARGFFQYLDSKKITSAVLHGWEGGFEGDLTDIDYVIEEEAFPQIASHVAEYCRQVGWRQCQILRHEATAAFCVCSAADDPSCVVALDACSDYQRNGSIFFSASELLEETIPLPWGGARLSEVNELKYRFIKAAAKAKPVEGIGQELAAYPEAIRRACEEWLEAEWQMKMPDWSLVTLEQILSDLHRRTCRSVGFLKGRSLMRMAGRVLNPTGMLVVMGSEQEETAERFRKVFGRLYFRTVSGRTRVELDCVTALIRSTLITVSECGVLSGLLGSRDLIFDARNDVLDGEINFAKFLEARCARREGLSR